MSKPFKLSAVLFGHSLDVRSVTSTPDNNIISGSRDKTAKFWKSNGFNTGYVDAVTYRDQKNFVACVLYLEATTDFPDGLVVTSGNDNAILAYKPSEPFATVTLKEHTNTVCTLSPCLESNSFLSGSWDTSAKYWNLNVSTKNSLTSLNGHIAAVWSVVQLTNSTFVTASADKTIGIWSKDGQRLKTLNGHTDCVRGLLSFPELQCFLSISNDATVKVWSYSGENLNTYYGHTNYIYSIARNKAGGDNCFVTSDEDRTVRYWENGVNTQTINLPAQSIWSVTCLNNGDVVTGSSDGVIRIFTQNEGRFADEAGLKQFEEEVNALAQQSCQEIGGYKVSDLPGKEALYDPGKRAGQMKMVREPHGVVAYKWVEDGENSHWEKVGDVLGGAGNKTNEGQMFEGKAYDYVFTVDVEDGKPPLKLPFNKGDDPYTAAHAFLVKNDLPPSYLDQVVEFILKNSKEDSVPMETSEYVDPFTGAARYTPGAPSVNAGNHGVNLDPFTGGNSYSTSLSTSGNSSLSNEQFFPQNVYRTFDMGDPKIILGKLKEFNSKLDNENVKVADSVLDNAAQLCTAEMTLSNKNIESLLLLLNWPDEFLFPVLDIVRIAAKICAANKEISLRYSTPLIEKLKLFISGNCTIPNNTLVAFRTLCNLCVHPHGEEVIFKHRVELLESITTLISSNKNIQIGMATFLLNSVILTLKRSDDIGVLLLASVVPDMIVHLEEPEAQFRALVALGTLLSVDNSEQKQNITSRILDNSKFKEKLKLCSSLHNNEAELKTKKCAVQVQNMLFN